MIGILEVLQAVGLGIAVFFVALLFWGLRRRPESASPEKPKVSVLVAARNEEAALSQCLANLSAQDYSLDLCEFIIIDDASADATPQIVEEYSGKDSRFRLLRLAEDLRRTQGPKKRALCAGLQISRGEIVMVMDADCIAAPRWISEMVNNFSSTTDVVCGAVHYEPSQSWWGKLAAFEGLVNMVLNAAVIGLGGALSCSGANFAYRRAAFLTAGGFDSGATSFSGDDDLLLQRMKARGQKIRFGFDPQTRIETEAPQDFASYWNRKRRHLSAGRRYAAHWIALAGLIYLGCLTSVLLGLLKAAGAAVSSHFIFIWGAFSLLILALFLRGLNRFGVRGWWGWAIPAAVLFPLFVALLQPLTLFSAPAWKGRGHEA